MTGVKKNEVQLIKLKNIYKEYAQRKLNYIKKRSLHLQEKLSDEDFKKVREDFNLCERNTAELILDIQSRYNIQLTPDDIMKLV
jgi:hypothetical protein